MLIRIILLIIVFSAQVSGQVTKIDISLPRANFDNLFQRRLDKQEFLSAVLNIDGNTYKDANIRFKGHTSLLLSKKPIRVKFDKNSTPPQLFKGIRKMDFNAMYTDKSFMREKLVWDIYAMMDGFGPREFGYANLLFNGTDNGINLMIEHIDKHFFKALGRPEGELFEAEFDDIAGNLSILPENELRRAYDNEGEKDNDYSNLKQLIEKLNNASDADFAATVNELFDMKTVYDWIILNSITMDGDTYAKNYYLYRDTERQTQQWSIIPWDYDLTFGRNGDVRLKYPYSMLNDYFDYNYDPFESTPNVLKDRLWKDPVLREEYKKRLKDVLQNIFTEEKLFPLIDNMTEELDEYIKKEPIRWGTYSEYKEQADAIKYFITARRGFLLATLFNPPASENDEVTLDVSSTGVPYRFVDHDGKVVGILTFSNISGLQKVTLHAYPSSVPPGFSADNSVKRYIELIPFPAGANFTAELKWEYINDPDLTEVGSGVLNTHGLESYKYNNGSWQHINSNINSYGNYVTIPDVNESNCGGGKYFALKIPDGFQQNWVKQQNLYWQRWYDVQSVNAQTVFLVGDDGTMLKSQDAGSSWTQIFLGIHLQFRSLALINSNVLYAGGMFGEITKSINGGTAWSMLNSGTNNTINGIKFRDEQNGYGVCDKGLIITTASGGTKWKQNQVSNSKNLYALEIIDGDEILAGGEQGAVYKSGDGGNSWKQVSSGSEKTINRFIKKGESEIYGVCNGGVIIYSGDKGDTWKVLQLNTNSNFYSIAIDSKSEIYAAGENGEIFHSSNGSDWVKDDNQFANDLQGMVSLGNAGLLIAGNSGTIMQRR